jgi:hypothetical protein
VTPSLIDAMRTGFASLPGLTLSLATAARLWGVDRLACDVALRVLVEEGFLQRTTDDLFEQARH